VRRNLLLILAAIALATSAAAEDTNRSLGFLNGRAWISMSSGQKLGYVEGVLDGIEHTQSYLRLVEKC